MSTIDPKWIQYDDSKLKTEVNVLTGVNELTIRDGILLEGVSVEYVNGSKLTIASTAPLTPLQKDIWIQSPAD